MKAHLFADRAGDEAPHRMRLPTRGLHDLLQRCALGLTQQGQHAAISFSCASLWNLSPPARSASFFLANAVMLLSASMLNDFMFISWTALRSRHSSLWSHDKATEFIDSFQGIRTSITR